MSKSGIGYKIINANSRKLLAVEGASKANGAKLVQWEEDAGPDKIWQFENAEQRQSTASGKKVLYDIVLNYIAVAESTRDRIDNGDCKRVFGSIIVELWEMDENNNPKVQLLPYNNMSTKLFNQSNHQAPPTVGLSYFQDENTKRNPNMQMAKVTYNIPESLLSGGKLMVVIKSDLGSRHKDNDFATYDYLAMGEEKTSPFFIDEPAASSTNRFPARSEIIQFNTQPGASYRDKSFTDFVIPGHLFSNTDDEHRIWVKLTFSRTR